ncbi:GMC oxidoreductase [Penicillium brevicompactum]|uniref:GMC oxidoreductase n=1 Tax=Penicillium brevicompactum TaxID=5074 RepID=A0A9W9QVF5_PENBR|nr:GMC oxidoreductase [Penicillium brevicompactum]
MTGLCVLLGLSVLALASAQIEPCGVNSTYDYVVVGGGNAGSVVGTRLAEGGFSVAILEAGGNYQADLPDLQVPINQGLTGGTGMDGINQDVDWNFQTQPQAGANNRELHYARGKCLGGSGTKGSYKTWANLVNDFTFEWDNILQYFERSVHFSPPDTSKRPENATTSFNEHVFSQSSNGSFIEVSYLNTVAPFSTWLFKALEAVGIKKVQDFNSGELLGAQYSSSTVSPISEQRSSSDYIIAGSKSSTLQVCAHTLAEKIVFDDERTAIGVQATYKNKSFTLRATKEVVLSAGAFQSPQILMLSGVGPAQTLKSLNIPIVAESLGVGQNMWDHIFFGITFPITLDTLTRYFNDPEYQTKQVLQYLASKSGALSGGLDFIGWEKIPVEYRSQFSQSTQVDLSEFPADWPEIEFISGNFFNSNYSNVAKQQPKDRHQYASILAARVAPTSRGNVTIISASASDKPIINPNWLTTETDQQVALAAFKQLRNIWKQDSLQSIVAGPEAYPGENVQSDEQILNAIRDSISPVWHASGTCRMGLENDTHAVLDSNNRVRGVHRLRVVDASAFPVLPPGHPQSTVCEFAI